jgi:hypothetical protein
MRMTYRYIGMMALCAAFASCEKPDNVKPVLPPAGEEEVQTVPYPQTPAGKDTFFALFEDVPVQTKVVLDDDRLLSWEENDKVSVWDGAAFTSYVAQSAGTQTLLSGPETESGKDYYAFYPADESVEFTDGTLSMTLPAEQTLVQGHFPYSPAVAFSRAADRDFRFRSICGMLGLTITREDIVSLSINGKKNEIIAGAVTVDLSDMKNPSWTVVEGEGEREITLKAADGQPLQPGTYYVAVLPQTFEEGIIISMFNSDNEQAERVRSKELQLRRGKYLNAGNVDALESWGTSYHISSADEFVQFMSKETYDATAKIGLLADIDLEGLTVGSIKKFDGVFDGNGFRIRNWAMQAPMIETLNGTLQNLVMDESCTMENIPADEDFAVMVRYNNGLVSNCANYVDLKLEGVEFTKAHSVGGVVAVTTSRVEECYNYGDIALIPTNVSNPTSNATEGSKLYLGGVVGKVNTLTDPVEIVLCENYGDITYSTEGCIMSQTFLGGVTGGTMATLCASLSTWQPYLNVMLRCHNEGKITYCYKTEKNISGSNSNSIQVGGVAGYWEGDMTSTNNYGDIDVKAPRNGNSGSNFLRGAYVGGVTSIISGSMTGCTNSGNIDYSATTAGAPATTVACGPSPWCLVGGVTAVAGNSVSTSLNDCHNKAEKMKVDLHMKSGNGTYGAAGGVCALSLSTIDNCSNAADITMQSYKKNFYFGGVAGYHEYFETKNTNNSGDLTLELEAPAGDNQIQVVNFGGVLGFAKKNVSYCNNSGAMTLNGGRSGKTYYVGGILAQASGNIYYYGTASDYMGNSGTITVDTPATVRVGGIEGSGSGGRLNYTLNTGDINVTSLGNNCYVGGLRGYCSGQILVSENRADVSLTSAGQTSYLSGITGYQGATQISNTFHTGDLSFKYTGAAVPEVYAGFAVGKLVVRCTLTGTYGGNISLEGVEGGNVNCAAAVGNVHYILEEGVYVTLGNETRPLGLKAGSVVNGVEITADNFDDKRLLVGGEAGVDYYLAPTNAIILE